MTPEIFFMQLMTSVVPIVVAFMIAGTVLGLLVKGLKSAAGRAITPPARRPSRR